MATPGGLPPHLESLLRLARRPRELLTPWRELDVKRLGRVLFHSVLVGLMAGGVAVAFFYGLQWGKYLLIDVWARLPMPDAGGEVHLAPSTILGGTRWWVVAILPALGGLGCGLLVHFFAPEAAGPGGDAYIESFHVYNGRVRGRVPLIKAVASILTIASGGSAGREGPTLQVSAGLGSQLARLLRLSDRERRILLIAGAAAGTGAMFRTPLGAALYGAEVLYRDDFETDAIVPCIIASTTAYAIVTLVFGPGHLFVTEASYAFVPEALPLFLIMGLGLSLVGVVFTKLRHGLQDHVFDASPLPLWAKPAIGGLALGVFAVVVPPALGTGYGWVQGAITGADWLPEGSNSAYLLLFGLAAAKMLAVSLTIGSGGSGGEMGPSLVVGALVGGAFGMLFHHIAPNLVPQPGAFALVGMGAFFGGIAHVPISSLIMVSEMAGSYDLLAPLMLTEGVCFVLLRRVAIYRAQLPGRIDSPAHRHDSTVDILEALRVRDIYRPGVSLDRVPLDAPITVVMHVMSESALPAVLVVDKSDRVRGIVSVESVQGVIFDQLEGVAVAADVLSQPAALSLDDDLHTAVHAFVVTGASALPVVDESEERVHVGVLTHADVDRAYDEAFAERLAAAAGLVEIPIEPPPRHRSSTPPRAEAAPAEQGDDEPSG